MPQRGASLAHPAPVSPTGTGGVTRPRHSPGQEGQDSPRGPSARLPTGHGDPTVTQAQPRRTTPLPRPRGTPAARPSPWPTTTAVPQHPSPVAWPGTTARTNPRPTVPAFTQGQGAWCHQHHHHDPAAGDPYHLRPQYYSDPNQLHHHDAPAQTAPTGKPPHAAHLTTRHLHVYHGHTHHHHQPLPWYHAVVPHTAGTTSPPPPHSPAPLAATTARARDIRATMRPDRPARGPANAPTAPAPARSTHHHRQSPQPQPMPASTVPQQRPAAWRPQPQPDAQATSSPLDTAASRGPQEPHDTHTRHPQDLVEIPDSPRHTPAPPRHQQWQPHTIPARPHPPGPDH